MPRKREAVSLPAGLSPPLTSGTLTPGIKRPVTLQNISAPCPTLGHTHCPWLFSVHSWLPLSGTGVGVGWGRFLFAWAMTYLASHLRPQSWAAEPPPPAADPKCSPGMNDWILESSYVPVRLGQQSRQSLEDSINPQKPPSVGDSKRNCHILIQPIFCGLAVLELAR